MKGLDCSAMLAGVRVVDLTMFVAGPFCTMLLADLGADVVKVEPLDGDPVRSSAIGPTIGGVSAQFHSYNRGKRSVAINLKAPAGREAFLDLVRGADAVVENFRPGVATKLGIDHAALAAVNPRIVTCSISAFGHTGPWRERPGYDLIVQALGGGMSLTGHPATGPAHMPFHLGDTAGGLFAAFALLAAMRERDRTGQGRALDISMLDAQLALLGDEATNLGTGRWTPAQHGAGHPALAPYRAFDTADRPIVVAAVGVEKFWRNLAAAIGRPELAEDPRFAGNAARVKNRAVLEAILDEVFRSRGQAEWLEILGRADVPAAPVLSVAEAIASPQAVARQMTTEVATWDGDSAQIMRSPVRGLGDGAPAPLQPAPRLGEHTHAVLAALPGWNDDRIEKLATAGVIRLAVDGR
ncbi:CaiB/BaiF CoA transferase family protein [Falsiroseomonas sp. E2-1-a4]|uniref:CaiB/BaiF CoA transferase family protein n=1 Tax=Falsiroseomonas sp. E2-1-a4 TaxID=3239299 RepID=UPI003F38DC4F